MAPIIHVKNAFYVIGGKDNTGKYLKTIGRMDIEGRWTQAGELKQAREGHNVIYDGTYLIVVGGRDSLQTEKCSIKSGSVICTSQNPELIDYGFYPELFLVPESFCKA